MLKYTAEYSDNAKVVATLWISGLLIVLGVAAITTITFCLFGDLAAILMRNPHISSGVWWAAPGLFLFSLNKVLLGGLNGQRRMRYYAGMQSLRALTMVVSLIAAAVYLNVYDGSLNILYSVAEGVIFLCMAPTIIGEIRYLEVKEIFGWVKKHISFGARGFGGHVLVEINSRIDILVLSVFANNWAVGVYSLASLFVEGMFQILVAVRTVLNPIITTFFCQNRISELTSFIAIGRRWVYISMSFLCLLSLMLYLPITRVITGGLEFDESFYLYAILISGLWLSSGYLPFSQLFMATGLPGPQTIYTLATVLVNVLTALLLTPFLSAYGCALATSMAVIFSMFSLRFYAKRLVGLRI